MGEGLSEQRTKRANYIHRAIHRAPLIDDEFFLLPYRFVKGLRYLIISHIHTHTNNSQSLFLLFFSKVEKIEKTTHREKKTYLEIRFFLNGLCRHVTTHVRCDDPIRQ